MPRNNQLMQSEDIYFESNSDHIASSEKLFHEVSGSYDPLRYSMKLNSSIRDVLSNDRIPDSDHRKVAAFSTYLHESIHWWQHIGSYSGLICSLHSQLVSHLNHDDIISLQKKGMLKKNIINCARKKENAGNGHIQRIVNNSIDFAFAHKFLMNPHLIGDIVKDEFYESIGHSMYMFWSAAIRTLKTTFSETTPFFHDNETWYPGFAEAKKNKEKKSYFGNEIGKPPFGLRALFEGQARVSQLQLIEIGSARAGMFSEFSKKGYIDGIYGESLKFYLNRIGQENPETMLSPIVNLFLLLCDISINPTEGFPDTIHSMNAWVYNLHPGIRFIRLCEIINEAPSEYLSAIKYCSNDEYFRVSTLLSSKLDKMSLEQALNFVANSQSHNPSINDLLTEEMSSSYADENFPIRLLVSKFIRFQADKRDNPCFFCWPGIHMSKFSTLSDPKMQLQLFNRHKPISSENHEGKVRATIFEHLNMENWKTSYDKLIGWLCVYDMTIQLISSSGPFEYHFNWISDVGNEHLVKEWVDQHFSNAFGFPPSAIPL